MFDIIPLKNGLENVEGFYFDGINSGFKKMEMISVLFVRINRF